MQKRGIVPGQLHNHRRHVQHFRPYVEVGVLELKRWRRMTNVNFPIRTCLCEAVLRRWGIALVFLQSPLSVTVDVGKGRGDRFLREIEHHLNLTRRHLFGPMQHEHFPPVGGEGADKFTDAMGHGGLHVELLPVRYRGEQVMVRLKREHQFSSVGDGKGYRQSDNPPTAGGAAVPKGSREVLIALV